MGHGLLTLIDTLDGEGFFDYVDAGRRPDVKEECQRKQRLFPERAASRDVQFIRPWLIVDPLPDATNRKWEIDLEQLFDLGPSMLIMELAPLLRFTLGFRVHTLVERRDSLGGITVQLNDLQARYPGASPSASTEGSPPSDWVGYSEQSVWLLNQALFAADCGQLERLYAVASGGTELALALLSPAMVDAIGACKDVHWEDRPLVHEGP